MSDISDIDKNFKVETTLNLDDVHFYNVAEFPWCIHGLLNVKPFRRTPEEIARATNEGVYKMHTNTAGGRVRFRTNSPYIAIHAVMPKKTRFPHMPDTGVAGFDLYADGTFVNTYIPPLDRVDGYEGVQHFPDAKEREIMIHFPLYTNVAELYVGIKEGCTFEEASPYKYPQKVLYYGSSITQGGCVCRPSMSFPALVSLELDCDYINLGFSGNAKGEPVMADYIAGLHPDIFVMDYDHNADSLEHLERTHENFFRIFRQANPNTPVVFMTAPNIRFYNDICWVKRRDVVYHTYKTALQAGDKQVYFIDGKDLWGDTDWRLCTADCLHPNDIGHYRMAKTLIPVIRSILETL